VALNFLPGAKVTDLRELESKRTCIKGSATRTAEDIETSQSFNMSEVKAIASDNPLILEKAQADQDLSVLESLPTAGTGDHRPRPGRRLTRRTPRSVATRDASRR